MTSAQPTLTAVPDEEIDVATHPANVKVARTLRSDEVVEALGVTQSAFQARVKRGKIPCDDVRKPGAKRADYRFNLEEVKAAWHTPTDESRQRSTEAIRQHWADPANKESAERKRANGRTINTYLKALAAEQNRVQVERMTENLAKAIAVLDNPATDPVNRLIAIRDRNLAQAILNNAQPVEDFGAVEKLAMEVMFEFSTEKQLTRAAWLEVGVPALVLDKVGIK